MKKEDSVKQYLDAYLEGKSENVCQNFLAKPLDKQYAAIMAWRYRRMKKDQNDSDSVATEIVELLKTARKRLSYTPEMSDDEIKGINREMKLFDNAMNDYLINRKQKLIAELEKQQLEISRRLDTLRSGAE